MKANELRIGNLVKNKIDGSVNPVNFLAPTDMGMVLTTSYFPHFTIEQAEPIPLTEDWLVKFGFNKSGDNCYRLGQLKQMTNQLQKGTTGHGSFFMYGSIIFTHIKHVHQLQNLYFALTCEELTIKD